MKKSGGKTARHAGNKKAMKIRQIPKSLRRLSPLSIAVRCYHSAIHLRQHSQSFGVVGQKLQHLPKRVLCGVEFTAFKLNRAQAIVSAFIARVEFHPSACPHNRLVQIAQILQSNRKGDMSPRKVPIEFEHMSELAGRRFSLATGIEREAKIMMNAGVVRF